MHDGTKFACFNVSVLLDGDHLYPCATMKIMSNQYLWRIKIDWSAEADVLALALYSPAGRMLKLVVF